MMYSYVWLTLIIFVSLILPFHGYIVHVPIINFDVLHLHYLREILTTVYEDFYPEMS